MKAMLLGYRRLDFKPDEGNAVKGTKLFIAHEDDGVIGLTCSNFFIGKDKEDVITIDLKEFIGKYIEVELNFKGKIACVSA